MPLDTGEGDGEGEMEGEMERGRWRKEEERCWFESRTEPASYPRHCEVSASLSATLHVDRESNDVAEVAEATEAADYSERKAQQRIACARTIVTRG